VNASSGNILFYFSFSLLPFLRPKPSLVARNPFGRRKDWILGDLEFLLLYEHNCFFKVMDCATLCRVYPRNAEFIPQPKGDMNIALQNLRDCDSFSRVIL